MTAPTVINLKDDYQPRPGDVYIGRGSKWGNPFRIGPDGTREQVIEKYRRYAAQNVVICESLPELDGRRLCCFCKPLACHGDVLIQMLKEMKR